ncbi:outer membrane beta-barrel protein [Crocinitomix catalasitica]|nr:outer membrane beta-barrel protein [Crocinitomix catalasitica]
MEAQKKILMVAIFSIGSTAFSQFTFSVNPGLSYNSANFGLKVKNFVPYLGIQYYAGKMSYTSSGTSWDPATSSMQAYSNKDELSGNLIIPTIGAKVYFLTGDLKAYINLNITKPILTAKYQYNGVEDTDVSDNVKAISIWGGELGFGAEYFFAPQFSIGGEFGLRLIKTKFKDTYDQNVFNPITGLTEVYPRTQLWKSIVSPTYSRISLNFYFGTKPKVSDE